MIQEDVGRTAHPDAQSWHLNRHGRPIVASLAYAFSPALWLAQAALIALAVARLQHGGGVLDVVWPALGLVMVGVVRAALDAWSDRRLFDHARDQLHAWRSTTIGTLAGRSPLDRHRPHAGAAASTLAEQADALLPWQTRWRSAVWRVRVTPVLLWLPVLWHSWLAALVLIVAAPLIPMFMAIVGWRARAASQEQWVQLGSMNAFLLDRLRGLLTLRSLDAVAVTAQRLRASNEDLHRRTMRVLRIAFLSSAVLELFAALGVAMVAAYIGFHLLGYLNFGAWGQRLTLAQGLFVLLLAPAFFEPLRELAAVWHDRAAGMAAMDALEQLNEGGMPLPDNSVAKVGEEMMVRHGGSEVEPHPVRAPARSGSAAAVAVPAPAVCVRFEKVTVAFPGERPAIQGFDLTVDAGERIALLGGSGSGKTVLLSVLAGLLPSTTGRIFVDGDRLTPATASALRQRMAWMGQRPHVFHGSVRDNIGLGRAGVDDDAVGQAIAWAQLDTVAQAHPRVSLGEGGTGLSGGEGKRLALARMAVAADAGLLLADEPTAHLDTATAAQVIDSLLALAHGRTLIVATHDPILASRMDRIVQLPDAAGDAACRAVA